MNTTVSNAVSRQASSPWCGLTGVPSFTPSLLAAAAKISVRKRLVNLVRAPAISSVVGSLAALAERSDRWAGLGLGVGESVGFLLNWVIGHSACWAAVAALGAALVKMAVMIALKIWS
jgi:hypothetical protein